MNSVLNGPEPHYGEKLQAVAEYLLKLQTPIYIVTHVDPDGDAIGSSLGLARALRTLGKDVTWIAEPPRYLRFLAQDGEFHPPINRVPDGVTLLVLDSAEPNRVGGAPVEGVVINLDHHGTNPRFGFLSVVDPSKAATAQIVKDLIELLGVRWTPEIAMPILTGLITDTGNFAFANTTPEVLHASAELVGEGVDLAELTDRLKWRPQSYFKALGAVMGTVQFHFGGLLVTAHMPAGMDIEDSDDFVGQIRYAEGAQIAVFLRERENGTKISIRSRGGVSAQAGAVALGGGGHVPAAGATLRGMGLEAAYAQILPAVEAELRQAGYL